jgi:hypothetical protein
MPARSSREFGKIRDLSGRQKMPENLFRGLSTIWYKSCLKEIETQASEPSTFSRAYWKLEPEMEQGSISGLSPKR